MVSPRLIQRQDMLMQQATHRHTRTMPLGSILTRINLTNFHRNPKLHRQPERPDPSGSRASDLANLRQSWSQNRKTQEVVEKFLDQCKDLPPESHILLMIPDRLQMGIKAGFLPQLGLALLTLQDSTVIRDKGGPLVRHESH